MCIVLRRPPAPATVPVVELWDSLAPGEISVPDWQRDLIRDRLAALEDILPEERSVPWEVVRKRLFSDRTGGR